jgi:hypothetical protein
VHRGEETHTIFIVISVTQSRLELMIDRIQGEQANNYTIDADTKFDIYVLITCI